MNLGRSHIETMRLVGIISAFITAAITLFGLPAFANNEQPPSSHSPAVELPTAESFERRFQRVVSAINANDLTSTFNQISELEQEAERNGVSNLLAFSMRLVDQAKLIATQPVSRSAAVKGETGATSAQEKIEFLLARAFELSPDEPLPYLESVTLWRVIGVEMALNYLWQGLSRIVYSARAVVLGGVTFWFLLLSASSLALLACCVVRLVLNLKRLIYAFSQAMPVRSRAVGSLLLVLGVLFFPLLGGPLCALAVWSITLSRYLREGKWFGVVAGVLIVAWSLTLLSYERVSMHAASPRLQAMDRVLRGSYFERDRVILEQAVAEWPQDSLVLLARGELGVLEGDIGTAERYLTRVLEIGATLPVPRTVQRRTLFTLGAIRYQQGAFGEAERFFQEVEKADTSFPVLYNMALTKLARVDTVGHQEYYQRARALDAAWLQRLENLSMTNGEPVFVWRLATPSSLLLRELFQPVPASLRAHATQAEGFRRTVEGHLLFWRWDWGPFSASIGLLGCLTLTWGYLLMIGREPRRLLVEKSNIGRSWLWALVPMGPFLLRHRPEVGLLMLTLFLACFMTGVSEPSLLPNSGAWSEAIRHLALLVTIVLATSSVIYGMLRSEKSV